MKYFVCIWLLFFLSCKSKENSEQAFLISKLVTEKKQCIQKNDSLLVKLNLLENNYWFDSFEKEKFIGIGWENPENKIENALRKRLDLIPLSAVLGGKMDFEKVQLLSNQWILASYSDGHVCGRALYEFNVNNKNQLEFKIFKSQAD